MSKERIEALLGMSGPPLRLLPAADPVVPDHALLRRIGQGSYGEVWLARNVAGTHRAIKVVYRDHFHDARPYDREYAGMLRFEPLSRSNEGFVDILQLGRNDVEGFFYYVMELADDAATAGEGGQCSVISDQSGATGSRQPLNTEHGSLKTAFNAASYVPRTLSSVLSQRHRLTVPECVGLGINLNLALGHLHRHGLIHRDVKPANIIFVGGVPKLADIGLVADIAGANTFVGTEGFIPPEGPNSPQADIYALGKLLYEGSMGKDRQEFPEPFTRMEADADVEELLELNAVILKACAPDPRERYATAEDMNADLALLQSGRSVRRKHAVEHRLRLVTRIGTGAAVAALVALGAWLWQAGQTREARRLSEENRTLAGRNRTQLVQLQVANGVRHMEEGNLAQSLAWFAKALPNVADEPARDEVHRRRIASVIESHPRLLHLFVHDSPVVRCQFTPDGQRLVSQTESNRVSVFDLKADRLLFSVTGARNSFTPHGNTYAPAPVISADGRRLVLRGLGLGQATEIRDLTDGHLLRLPDTAARRGFRMLDSLDGRTVLVAENDTTARILDLDSGAPLSPLMTASTNILTGRLAAGGRHVALLAGRSEDLDDESRYPPDSALQVWELGAERPFGPIIPVYQRKGDHFLVTGDGARLVTHGPGRMMDIRFRIYDSRTGTPIENAPDLEDKIAAWVVNPDEQWLVYPTEQGETRLWNPDKGETPTLKYAENIRHLALSADRLLVATASDDNTARVWNVATGRPLSPPLHHASWVYAVALHPDGHLLASGSVDRTLQVWDLAATRQAERILRERDRVVEAAFSPDGQKLATLTSYASSRRLWDAKTGQPRGRPLAAGSPMGELQFSPDGKRFAVWAGVRKRKALGDYRETGAQLRVVAALEAPWLSIHTNAVVLHAEFSPESERIVTAGHTGIAQVWEVRTGRPLGEPLKHRGAVKYATFSPDGSRIATTEFQGGIRLWDAGSGRLLREIEPAKTWNQVRFSPDGHLVVAAGGHQVAQVWDAESGTPVTPPVWHGGTVVGATFSPEGHSFLTYGPAPHVGVWKLNGGDQPTVFLRPGTGGAVADAEFSRDGRWIVSCSDDGTARLWDAVSGEPMALPMLHAGGVYSAHISPAGDRVLTAGHDRTARLWKLGRFEGEAAEAAELGELLFGARLLDNGVGIPLTVDESVARFDRLRVRVPGWFQPATPHEQAGWHEGLGEVAELSRNWEAVVRQRDHALLLDPTLTSEPTGDEIIRRRGAAKAELGNWPGAAEDYGHAVQLAPDKVFNWFDWLSALAVNGQTARYQSASTDLVRQFRWLDDDATPEHNGIRTAIAGICALGANTPENLAAALRQVAAVRANSPETSATGWWGSVFARAGRHAEAIQQFEAVRESSELDFNELAWLALAHHDAGRLAESRRSLELADQELESRILRGKTNPDAVPVPIYRAIFGMLRKEVAAKLASAGE